MPSATIETLPLSSSSSSSFPRSSTIPNQIPRRFLFRRNSANDFKSLKCTHRKPKPNFSVSCSAVAETPIGTSIVDFRLQSLVSEFRSLSEATDRVKRLLHYADLLPPFDESARVRENAVTGCTAQVWLEARMDAGGAMRFRADSDSEITKGFSSCLIWMLDGAAPEEVLKLRTEDLGEMNVGLIGRTHSRINTWHIVLISMQKRTRILVAERDRDRDRILAYSSSSSSLVGVARVVDVPLLQYK